MKRELLEKSLLAEIERLPGIGRDTIEELNHRFLQAKKPGHTRRVLRELCGIEQCVVDV